MSGDKKTPPGGDGGDGGDLEKMIQADRERRLSAVKIGLEALLKEHKATLVPVATFRADSDPIMMIDIVLTG